MEGLSPQGVYLREQSGKGVLFKDSLGVNTAEHEAVQEDMA